MMQRYFFQFIDALAEQNAGLKYDDFEYFHVFICKSASEVKPTITFKDVEDDSGKIKNVRIHEFISEFHRIVSGRFFITLS